LYAAFDLGGLFRRGQSPERGGAPGDAEIAQKGRLIDRSGHPRAHAFGGNRERLEIDVGGQVYVARGRERIDEGVAANRLQSVTGRALGVAVVDDEGRTALVDQPPAQRE